MAMVCRHPFIFSKNYISNVSLQIGTFHVKHHQVGKMLHKVFGLIGLECWLPWQHKVPIDLQWVKKKKKNLLKLMGPTAYIFST